MTPDERAALLANLQAQIGRGTLDSQVRDLRDRILELHQLIIAQGAELRALRERLNGDQS